MTLLFYFRRVAFLVTYEKWPKVQVFGRLSFWPSPVLSASLFLSHNANHLLFCLRHLSKIAHLANMHIFYAKDS